MNILDKIDNYLTEKEGKMAGWIAIYNSKKFEIKKSEAKDIWAAKQMAYKHFKVPKSKQGLLAIKPGYDD